MLELRNISKRYPGFSLQDVSMQVPKGSYFVLLGPSGAGKTQVLEIIAGLVKPDEGQIIADGKDITHMSIRQRPVGLVFQDLALFPHLSVEKNIAYGLKGKFASSQATAPVRKQAERLGIIHLLNRMPSTLSGGEQQRAALARTLARQPDYLLLDEPLSSLDVQIRQEVIGILRNLHRSGLTILHVTHDFEETLVLATHVAVMHQGRIIQSGEAGEVFHKPGSEFVARFTGIKNYFPAILDTREGVQQAILHNAQHIRVITDDNDGEGFVMIPGEEIILSNEKLESSATNQIKGIVREILNAHHGVEVEVDAGMPFFVKITGESLQHLGLAPGKEVWLSFKASAARFIRA